MHVHLIDGTFELFRNYFGAPSARTSKGREVGATRGLMRSFAAWLRTGEVTHAACAFDHVIESFRNDLFSGYKTSAGMDPELYAQFELAERAVAALGMVVWPMVEFEADDALSSGAAIYSQDPAVEKIWLCTPDKDLAQSVVGVRIVGFDRMRKVELNEAGVVEKFGVPPTSIPDLLALVGDTADGIPGVPRWGMKSAAAVLSVYRHVENIPLDAKLWSTKVRGAEALATSLAGFQQEVRLYRQLATLRIDAPLKQSLQDLAWQGADRVLLQALCEEIEDPKLMERVERWR